MSWTITTLKQPMILYFVIQPFLQTKYFRNLKLSQTPDDLHFIFLDTVPFLFARYLGEIEYAVLHLCTMLNMGS